MSLKNTFAAYGNFTEQSLEWVKGLPIELIDGVKIDE